MISQTRQRFGRTETRVLSVPGDGTPIVLLHGYGDTADTWRGVLSRFKAAGRQAFAPDLPGFGYADARADGPLLPQFDAFADAVVERSRSIVLLGNSLGAGRRSGPRHVTRTPSKLLSRWLTRSTPAIGWRGSSVDVPYRSGSGRPSPRCPSRRRCCAVPPGHETRAGHDGINVTCPTLIVHGARDRIVPVAASRLLHQQIPGSDLVVLPHSGHCPQLDNPSEVVRLTLRLLHEAQN
jgi:pimeloyl-ACP methyl ester carboxylesterase